LPAELIEGTNKTISNLDRRLGIYRESNPNLDSSNHIYNFFGTLIGKPNCMLLDKPSETQNQEKTLKAMQKKLE